MIITQTENGTRVGDVEFIWARNSKEFLFSNSILIHGDKPIIVDPSAAFTYISNLASSHYVKIVLNTHFHGDHRSLNQLFKGAIFASHEMDADAISNFKHYAKMSADDQDSYYLEWTRQVFKKYHIVECPVSIRLKGDDILDSGDEKIKIVHTPGHTPGHVALFFENANALFVSDIDLTPYGPWYASPVSDIEQFKESIQKIKSIECQYYVSSHGERVYDRETFLIKLDRFNSAFDTRNQKILELLKTQAMEMHELCSQGIIYKKSMLTDPLKSYFQYQMVIKHVDLLVKEGLIRKEGEKFWANT